MNINATMKKLQTAILQTGLAISINRSQFFSHEQKRFIQMISLSTRVFHYYEKIGEWKDQTYEIIRTSSQVENLTRTTMNQSQKDLVRMLDEVEIRVASGIQSYASAICEILDNYAGKKTETAFCHMQNAVSVLEQYPNNRSKNIYAK